MISVHLVLIVAALIVFLMATFNFPSPKINLVALSLFFYVLAVSLVTGGVLVR